MTAVRSQSVDPAPGRRAPFTRGCKAPRSPRGRACEGCCRSRSHLTAPWRVPRSYPPLPTLSPPHRGGPASSRAPPSYQDGYLYPIRRKGLGFRSSRTQASSRSGRSTHYLWAGTRSAVGLSPGSRPSPRSPRRGSHAPPRGVNPRGRREEAGPSSLPPPSQAARHRRPQLPGDSSHRSIPQPQTTKGAGALIAPTPPSPVGLDHDGEAAIHIDRFSRTTS